MKHMKKRNMAKKTMSCALTLGMLVSTVPVQSIMAEENSDSYEKPFEVNVQQVEADGDQVALESHVKNIIEVDGLKFKDLNDNGELDVYEDWRADTDDRVEDLLSQMTLEEKVGTLFHATVGGTFTSLYPINDEFLYSNDEEIYVDDAGYTPVYHQIITDYNNTFLQNVNGTPEEQIDENNAIQEIGEYSRLGIPIVFSSDRSYNSWGGMVNMSNYAFGVAHDEELLTELASEYAKEMNALGYTVLFHSYGVEIGSWYGDKPSYIAQMTAAETAAYEENGVNATTKHFIARGGRSNYSGAVSPADLLDSWMVGWKAAVDAGTSWVMMNHGTALNDCYTIYDSETVSLLRDDLGYDGVIVTDWPMWVGTPSATGTTPEGEDLSTMNAGELYTTILKTGIDQFGCFFMVHGTDESAEYLSENYPGHGFALTAYPDSLIAEIENGNCDMELIDRSVRRVLKNKFELGLFEDPYRDLDSFLELAASNAYTEDQFAITSIEDIYAARTDEMNELEIRLQTESTVLLKNDDDILPLAEGTKVYVTGDDEDLIDLDIEAIAEYADVVEDIEDADVVIARAGDLDVADEIIEEAQDEGKKIVLAIQAGNGSSEPTSEIAENSDGLLMMTYNTTPDHGSTIAGTYINHYTLSSTLAEMIFGVREPSGSLVYEIARTDEDAILDWGELAVDTGVDTATRLFMAATVRQDPTADLPNNLGDVLYPSEFGMSYGKDADINLNTLVMDQVVEEVEVESAWGTSVQQVAVNKTVQSGEAFPIYLIADNAGADGTVMAEVYEGDNLVASQLVSVEGESFAVVTIYVTLEGAGEHVLNVGDNTLTVTVE
jgi:beta-glucosidase